MTDNEIITKVKVKELPKKIDDFELRILVKSSKDGVKNFDLNAAKTSKIGKTRVEVSIELANDKNNKSLNADSNGEKKVKEHAKKIFDEATDQDNNKEKKEVFLVGDYIRNLGGRDGIEITEIEKFYTSENNNDSDGTELKNPLMLETPLTIESSLHGQAYGGMGLTLLAFVGSIGFFGGKIYNEEESSEEEQEL